MQSLRIQSSHPNLFCILGANFCCIIFLNQLCAQTSDLCSMHVQHSRSETTRIHDLSTRKVHLIRGNRRTAVPTNRTIRTICESLLRAVSIRVLHVIVQCRSKGSISGGARKCWRREPLGGQGACSPREI